jgi:CxxC motif-containing protein (DUF1111 family)
MQFAIEQEASVGMPDGKIASARRTTAPMHHPRFGTKQRLDAVAARAGEQVGLLVIEEEALVESTDPLERRGAHHEGRSGQVAAGFPPTALAGFRAQ